MDQRVFIGVIDRLVNPKIKIINKTCFMHRKKNGIGSLKFCTISVHFCII